MITKMALSSRAYYNKNTIYIAIGEGNYRLEFTDSVYSGTSMTTLEARNLARNLYKLARRIDKRSSSETPAASPVVLAK